MTAPSWKSGTQAVWGTREPGERPAGQSLREARRRIPCCGGPAQLRGEDVWGGDDLGRGATAGR